MKYKKRTIISCTTSFLITACISNAYALDANTANLLNQLGQAVLKSIPATDNQQQSIPQNQNVPADISQPSTATVDNNNEFTPVGTFLRIPKAQRPHSMGSYPVPDFYPYPPTGLERGAEVSNINRQIQAMQSLCKVKSSVYYEVVQYKNVVNTRQFANGKTVDTTQVWVNLKNVGNPECAGWVIAKRTPTDSFGSQWLSPKDGFKADHPNNAQMCPSGWRVGFEAPGNVKSFECFAPIATPISDDYVCEDLNKYIQSELNKNPNFNVTQAISQKHQLSQNLGLIGCSGGKGKLTLNKVVHIEDKCAKGTAFVSNYNPKHVGDFMCGGRIEEKPICPEGAELKLGVMLYECLHK